MALIKPVKASSLNSEKLLPGGKRHHRGDVIMGDDCSIWFQAVVRGDVHYIRMGNKVNVQDGPSSTAPTSARRTSATTFHYHRFICTLKDNVLVGMGAIVMDRGGARRILIAAGAGAGKTAIWNRPHLRRGCRRRVKALSAEAFKDTVERIANNYVDVCGWFR